jgi:hypothetical protein
MKKVAFLLIFIPVLCFGQTKILINTDLEARTDTCIKPFRSTTPVSISFDFTALRSDTTTLTVYLADWDSDLHKYIPTNASIPFNLTFPLTLNKTTYRTIFDVDYDGDRDTISALRLWASDWPTSSLCWTTAKQDSGIMIVRINK